MRITVRRGVRLLRRFGDGPPQRHHWSCLVDGRTADPDTLADLDVRIEALDGPDGGFLDEPSRRLHAALARQLPPMLRMRTRVEVGAVHTGTGVPDGCGATRHAEYTLVTCENAVVTLVEQLNAAPAVPWRGVCVPADLDPGLPLVLGPSAVLSLAAAALELCDEPGPARAAGKAVPAWMSVCPVHRSPYPPHAAPPGLDRLSPAQRDEVSYWAGHAAQWMRPMRTTRSSRGQYEVRAALPSLPAGPAVWVESLVSLDTHGRYWHASLSVGPPGERRWLSQPWSVEVGAGALLDAAVGEVQPPRPALDRDPVDGESYGWAPALLLDRAVGTLPRA